jgi:acyl-coenzyme A synthetase/AMP-(fatty) acid ligase
VPPAELEAKLLDHPAIADVAVVGIPDPYAGEVRVCGVCGGAVVRWCVCGY